jgi:hypothetical protein
MGQYDRVLYEGKEITHRQRQAINHVTDVVDKRFGLRIHIYQGSWRPATPYSGTTHTGAGVADFYVYGMATMGEEKLNAITRILRGEGCQAAQLRGPFVDMPWHWHTNDLDKHGMDPNAAWQVDQYLAKGGPYNGLEAGVPSHNPWRPDHPKPWDFKP